MIVEDIALTLTPGLGSRRIARLLEVFSSAEKIFAASRDELVHFAKISPTLAEAIVKRVAFTQAQREVEYCRKNGIHVVASTDEAYPPLLRHANDYPHVLYVVGNIEALQKRNVSVIGTRRMSSYGDRMTHDLVKGLAAQLPDLAIISGLAFGIDSAAHRAALAYGTTTVAVVANALPAVTPAQHTSLAADIVANGGAIVSECHSHTNYRPDLYIARNRIIAAMSEVTVVAESPKSGGSMVTANIAAGYGRAVMAIPARVDDKGSEGCNSLIANNVAQIYLSPEQLIRTMMWDIAAPADRAVANLFEVSLTALQRSIIACFNGDDIISIEEMCIRLQQPVNQITAALFEMEMFGLVSMLPGSRCELLNSARNIVK